MVGDFAVLHARTSRKELVCHLTRIRPFLGFDLIYHAGFEVRVPPAQFGDSKHLTIMVGVTPVKPRGQTKYFIDSVSAPSEGDAEEAGLFDLGEGQYQMDWLIRDRRGRFRSSHWPLTVGRSRGGRKVETTLHPGAVEAPPIDPFDEEPRGQSSRRGEGLNVEVLVNVAPPDASAAVLSPQETYAVVSILKVIARDPRIGKLSLVAFDLPQGLVIYRHRGGGNVDFPALRKAMDSLEPGTIDAARLGQKNAQPEFLRQLMAEEIDPADPPDAVIFAGPRATRHPQVSLDCLKELGSLRYPVFYLDYNADPSEDPWGDLIVDVVRYFRGREYMICKPLDLWLAWKNILERTATFRLADGRPSLPR